MKKEQVKKKEEEEREGRKLHSFTALPTPPSFYSLYFEPILIQMPRKGNFEVFFNVKFPVLVNIAVDFTEKKLDKGSVSNSQEKVINCSFNCSPAILVGCLIGVKDPFLQIVFDFTLEEITTIS